MVLGSAGSRRRKTSFAFERGWALLRGVEGFLFLFCIASSDVSCGILEVQDLSELLVDAGIEPGYNVDIKG